VTRSTSAGIEEPRAGAFGSRVPRARAAPPSITGRTATRRLARQVSEGFAGLAVPVAHVPRGDSSRRCDRVGARAVGTEEPRAVRFPRSAHPRGAVIDLGPAQSRVWTSPMSDGIFSAKAAPPPKNGSVNPSPLHASDPC